MKAFPGARYLGYDESAASFRAGVNLKNSFRATIVLFLSLASLCSARAQAFPTATQPLQVSVFGAGTGTWTGLEGGRNLGLTAGLNVGWKPFFGFYPAAEARGTYPVDGGHIDAQRNILFGFRAARMYGRLEPYADFLLGRDKIVYQNGGYPNPSGTLIYLDSVSNVFSYGGGLDLAVTDQISFKLDAQLQRYGVPVTSSGHIVSTPVSLGIVYHFNFNRRFHYDAKGQIRSR